MKLTWYKEKEHRERQQNNDEARNDEWKRPVGFDKCSGNERTDDVADWRMGIPQTHHQTTPTNQAHSQTFVYTKNFNRILTL